jgi:hypothetical protein
MTAYPLQTIDMNDVDPRFLGVGVQRPYQGGPSSVVWFIRVAAGLPDADGATDGIDRVIDDATGAVLKEMPLTVDPGYQPTRLIFESGKDSRYDFGQGFYPMGEVRAADAPVFADSVGYSSTPVALTAGDYVLRGFVGNQFGGGDIGDLTCDQAITVDEAGSVAYAATFTKNACSWTQVESQF